MGNRRYDLDWVRICAFGLSSHSPPLRDGRDRAAPVLSRGGREGGLPRQLTRLPEAVCHRVPRFLQAVARVTLIDASPPNNALMGDWYNHATYGVTFLLGFALAGTRKPWITLKRLRWSSLIFALLGWAFLAGYLSIYGADNGPTPPYLLMMFRRVVFGAEQWLAIAAVLGFARQYLNHDNAARRYLTTAIFPVYILHQTIIVVLAHSLKPLNLMPAVEGPLLILVTAAGCLAGYEIIRRVALFRPLFGLAMAAPARLKCSYQ